MLLLWNQRYWWCSRSTRRVPEIASKIDSFGVDCTIRRWQKQYFPSTVDRSFSQFLLVGCVTSNMCLEFINAFFLSSSCECLFSLVMLSEPIFLCLSQRCQKSFEREHETKTKKDQIEWNFRQALGVFSFLHYTIASTFGLDAMPAMCLSVLIFVLDKKSNSLCFDDNHLPVSWYWCRIQRISTVSQTSHISSRLCKSRSSHTCWKLSNKRQYLEKWIAFFAYTDTFEIDTT